MGAQVKIILAADNKPLKLAIDGAVASFDKLGHAAGAAAATTNAGISTTRAGINSISKQLEAAKESVRGFALTAAGVFSATQLIRMANEASNLAITMERYSNTLKFASGSTAAFAVNSAFLQSTVRTLGLDLQSASQQFASLTAAAKGTSLEGAGARSIFDAVGKAATVMGLTADQTSGSLLAISQMISKGTVSAEELRGQLGERLPGAFQIAARAMGVTTAELGKMLESGALATDVFLPRFAAQMRQEMGGSVKDAADSVQANLNRVNTSWATLVTTVNNSAFKNEALKGIDQFLTVLTGTLQNSKSEFKGWGDAVADVLAFVGDAAAGAIRMVGALGNAYGGAAALAVLYVEKIKALNDLKTFNSDLKYDYNTPNARAQALAIQANYDAATQAVRDGVADVGKALVNGSATLRDGLARQREQIAAAANDPELKRLADRSRAALDDADRALLASKPVMGSGKGNEAAATQAKSQAQAYVDLIAAIQAKISAEALEAQSGQKLSDAQKEQINIDKLVAQGKISVKAATSDKTKAVLAELAAAELATAIGKAQVEANVEASRAQAKFHADEARDIAAYEAAQTKAAAHSLQSVTDKVDALRLEEQAAIMSASANITLGQAIEQLTVARLQEKQAMYRPGSEGFDALQREIDMRRELMGVLAGKETREAGIKSAKEAADAWAKAADKIQDTLTDAIMRGFESGKGFAKSLRDTLVNMFKTMVLRPIISAVVNPVAQALTGTLGMAGSASAAGGAGGNSLGTAASLGSIYKTIAGGFDKLANNVAFAAQDMGAWLVNNTTGMLNQAGASLMQNAGTFGTVAGYAAGAAAGLAIGNAISGGYGKRGIVTVGTGIGAIFGGPIGAAIGGAIGGLVNRAFGRGPTKLTASGTRGTFADTAFNGENYANFQKKGGWFRSNKNWSEISAVDPATVNAWSTAFAGVKGSVAGMAASLGLATDKIAAYSKYVNIAAGTTAEQLTALFTGMADDMALAAAPALAQFKQTGETASATLSRLGGSLQTVNLWLGVLDHSLLAMTLSGGDAASKLVNAFGGIDAMASASKAYYDLFWTDSERLADTTTNVGKALALVNVVMPRTKDAFRATVTALDLTTNAGRNAYAVMLALAPEFAQVADAADAARQATQDMSDAMSKTVASAFSELRDLVQAAEGDLVDAFKSAASALTDTADRFASIQDTFRDFAQSLSGLSGAGQSLAYLRGEFSRLSDLARLGDAGAASRAVGVGDQLAANIIATSGSRREADLQLAHLAAQANATASIAQEQKTIAQQQLDTLKAVVGKLVDVEDKTLSVEEAMNNLRVLQSVENTSIAAAIAGGFSRLLVSNGLNLDGTARGNDLAASILSGINTMAGIQQAAEDDRIRQGKIDALTATGLLAAQAYQSAAASQQTAVGGVKAGISDIWSLAAAHDVFLNAERGALDWTNSAQLGVDEAGQFVGKFDQTTAASADRIDAFQREFRAPGGARERTYGQASVLAALEAAVTASSAELERQRLLVRALGGIPAFASGGSFTGGLRLVGERGPELEVTGPSRIFDASQTRGLLGGGGNGRLEALVQRLTQEVQGLRDEARATATNTNKTAKILSRVTPDGSSLQTVAA